MNQKDQRWEIFFKKTNALKQLQKKGYICIRASDLKQITNYEPRLLAKQDTLEERPKVFEENNLSILPIENGKYVVFRDPEQLSFFRFSAQDFQTQQEIYTSQVDLNSYVSYPGAPRLTESQAIDFAYVSSLLRHYSHETELVLTIRGRTRSRKFDISLPESSSHISISGVQIEVDAGYESKTALYLIEAKIGRRENFNIRQLYYPYLNWRNNSPKRIVPIFLSYTNSKYYFFEFSFNDYFGNINLVRKECYSVNESPVVNVDITALIKSTQDQGEPINVPYPQANDLDKVIDTLTAIDSGHKTKQEIARFFEFDERQGDYYSSACRYLGFAKKKGVELEITELGSQFLGIKSPRERTLFIVTSLVRRTTFRKFFELLRANDWKLEALNDNIISEIIAGSTSLSKVTSDRRASTVRQWLKWVLSNTTLV